MTFEKAIAKLVTEYLWAKNQDYIKDPVAYSLYHVWKQADSKKKPVITNGDSVRHMTDDQLAYWIMCPHDHVCTDDRKCLECTREWLKKPAEGD